MATRLKTIEYVFPMQIGSYAEGTTYTDSADLTIYIPETTSRTFKSCYLDVAMHDNQATAGDDVASVSIRASCDAGSNWTTATRTTTVADTGENISFRFFADITAEFVARFTGTSDTLRWGWYVDYASATNSPVLTNVSCKVVITYEYSDTSLNTRIKTVRIPLQGNADSATASLTTSLANLGGIADQIPALDTFCPEASKTYRAIFLEFWMNTNPIAHTTDTEFECKVGSLTANAGAVVEMGQAPSNLIRHTYDCFANSMPTNAAQNVQVRSVTNADAFSNVGAILTVTYEYSHDNSTSILNSVIVPCVASNESTGSSFDDMGYTFLIDVAEPGTITMVQSAIALIAQRPNGGTGAASGLTLKATGQTGTAYYINKYVSSTDYGLGGFFVSHRVDNDSSTWSVAAGFNRLTALISQFGGSTSSLAMTHNALLYLNYTSSKATAGAGAHNHTTMRNWRDLPDSTSVSETTPLIVVPETNPTLQGLLILSGGHANYVDSAYSKNHLITNGTENGYPSAAAVFSVENYNTASGLWTNELHWQWRQLCTVPSPYASRLGNPAGVGRFTSDPAVALGVDPYLSRSVHYYSPLGITAYYGCVLIYQTYHDITYTVSGTISGYTGDGSGITVEIWNKDEDWLEATATTTTGGAYTATVRTRDTVYAVARQDDTHCGRSADGTGS